MRLWPFGGEHATAAGPTAAAQQAAAAPAPEKLEKLEKPAEAHEGWFSSAYEGVKHGFHNIGALAGNAKAVIKSLSNVSSEIGDPPKVVQRFLDALPAAAPFADKKADAIAIGCLGEAGVGILESTGTDVMYIRAQGDRPARLRVSDIAGNTAKLNAGVGSRAFLRCLYGDADLIAAANRREGAEMGVIVANVGVFNVTVDPPKGQEPDPDAPSAAGWATALGAGLGLGVPFIGDLGMFSIVEKPTLVVNLGPEDTAKIEAQLAASPDRSTFRALATKLEG